MKKVGNTFRERKQEILSYFNSRVTNAIAEGINSMIQTAKRKARGFNTIE
jgi:transposase